eukprot:EG_transcript_8849
MERGEPDDEGDQLEDEMPSLSPNGADEPPDLVPEAKKRRRRKKRLGPIVVNTTHCKYNVVRESAERMGWQWDDDPDNAEKGCFTLFWTDTSVNMERVMRIQPYQRLNHFPSMHLICRKVALCNTMYRARGVAEAQFRFYPRTWALPGQLSDFRIYYSGLQQKKTFIIKPSAGCQGKGIVLTRSPMEVVEQFPNCVVQQYITKPMLIDGYKFDMRVYAMVTNVCDLNILLFQDGLIRLCTQKYTRPTESNLECAFMHLTNYAINKKNENFEFNEDGESGDRGSKRDFAFMDAYLQSIGLDARQFWTNVEDVIIKTLIAAQPQLQHVYKSCFPSPQNDGHNCFEILGFDIMPDHRGKVYLLEVNHSPSFTCDSPLDTRIKSALITETMALLNLSPDDKLREGGRQREHFLSRLQGALPTPGPEGDGRRERQQLRREHEDRTMQLYRRIFPSSDPARQCTYEELLVGMQGAMARATACEPKAVVVPAAAEGAERPPAASKRPSLSSNSLPGTGGRRKDAMVRRDGVRSADTAKAALEARTRLLEQVEKHKSRIKKG